MKKVIVLGVIFFMNTFFINCQTFYSNQNNNEKIKFKVKKSEKDWKDELTPKEFNILRNKGTERPYTGVYNMHFEKGIYECRGCGQALFRSENKFNSDCGWPSYESAIPGTIIYKEDKSLGMVRTEIICSNCGGHQGHVFDDGPTETGKRYCVNSASINFINNKK